MRLGAGAASGTGGTLRASTAASPVAAPMTVTSTTASRANTRPSPGRCASTSTMLRRCSQPSTPSTTMATVFRATTAPYAVNSPSIDPSRIQACCAPLRATAPKHHAARVE